jgi:hypothetical protein
VAAPRPTGVGRLFLDALKIVIGAAGSSEGREAKITEGRSRWEAVGQTR